MVSVSNLSAIDMCNIAVDAVDGGAVDAAGQLIFYDGTPPTNVDTALAGNTILAELDMSTPPAFGGAVDSIGGATATANPITDDTAVNAPGGTATFARIESRANVPVLQLTVDTSNAEIIVNTTNFVTGAVVEVTSLTVTMPES